MSSMTISVLLVEDNPIHARLLQGLLSDRSDPAFAVEAVDHLEGGIQRLSSGSFDAVLLDLVLPGIIAIVVLVLLAVLWTNTAEVVVVAALYEFSKTGEMPDLDGAGKQVQERLGWENESPEMTAWREGTA